MNKDINDTPKITIKIPELTEAQKRHLKRREYYHALDDFCKEKGHPPELIFLAKEFRDVIGSPDEERIYYPDTATTITVPVEVSDDLEEDWVIIQ